MRVLIDGVIYKVEHPRVEYEAYKSSYSIVADKKGWSDKDCRIVIEEKLKIDDAKHVMRSLLRNGYYEAREAWS